MFKKLFKNKKFLVLFLFIVSSVIIVFKFINSQEGEFYALEDKIYNAYNKGQYKKAKKLTNEYLNLAEKFKDNWNYGNAIHHGYQVLGLLSLQENNLQEAKYYLLRSAKTPGSPQLNSFGPSFMLAKRLLMKGEKESVLEYLDLIANFWVKQNLNEAYGLAMDNKKMLEKWKKEVEKDLIPNDPKWVER